MGFAMDGTIYKEEINIPNQTFFYDDSKKIKIEDNKSTFADESSIGINEEKLRAGKGIIYGLIFCIPFWLFFIKFFIWLF